VLCEVVLDGGGMARLPELTEFAALHGLVLVSIRELIAYRRRTEKLVTRLGESRLPTQWGDFHCVAFGSRLDDHTHLAFVRGDPSTARDVLVRVHSECLTGDVFGSRRCDCGPQLQEAMRRVAAVGTGAIVYLRGHEGRGIGIGHKLRAYQLQEQGFDTVDANVELGFPVDGRDYSVGAQILADLGVTTMRLMTNNPVKYRGLEAFGLDITERVPLLVAPHADNVAYLRTKRERLGHFLPDDDELHALIAEGC
jgi:3,4-dihydroxy 2-butanone 4-phosphate synthase/GTP cyclohydrolase II